MKARYLIFAMLAAGPGVAHAARCGELTKLTVPNTVVSAATAEPAGAFAPADIPGKTVDVSAFCRVQLRATPVPDSDIGMEVWLPKGEAWNGKLLGIGNGGYSSVLDYAAMAEGVRAPATPSSPRIRATMATISASSAATPARSRTGPIAPST